MSRGQYSDAAFVQTVAASQHLSPQTPCSYGRCHPDGLRGPVGTPSGLCRHLLASSVHCTLSINYFKDMRQLLLREAEQGETLLVCPGALTNLKCNYLVLGRSLLGGDLPFKEAKAYSPGCQTSPEVSITALWVGRAWPAAPASTWPLWVPRLPAGA